MHNLYCVLVLIIFFSTNLIAADKTSLANQEPCVISHSPPNAFVNDTVNAINGNFFFSMTHLRVPGAVPLPFIQYYNNQSRYSSWLGEGMTLNHCFWMQGQEQSDKSQDKHDKFSLMLAEAPGGSIIRCIGKPKKETETRYYYLDPEVIHDGLTNCGSGEMNARTNLKNCYITEKVKNNEYADWTIHLPDGTIREYHRSYDKAAAMNVKHEYRPNYTQLDYDFHKGHSSQDEGSIKRITAKGKHELNWLKFDIFKDDHKAVVTSSNDREVKFKYFKKNGERYIEEVDSSDNPKIEFHYTKAGDYYCIDRISWPHGRFLEVEYDHKGRVTSQKAPVGKDGEKRTIWNFSYHPDSHYTKVEDANGHKSIYRYRHKRLTALEHYTDKLFRTQAYYWGEKEGLHWAKQPDTDEGNLQAVALLDSDEKAQHLCHYTYDEHGNITKETLFGNLTGTGKAAFAVSSEGVPRDSHVEHYNKRYTYSKGRLRLKLTESEDEGPKIEYRYMKGTDLLWAKFTRVGDEIKRREFFSYDEDGILIRKIVDDGSTGNKKSLTGVTTRLITKIFPVKDNGLPRVVAERYLDLKTGKTALLKRTVYVYNKAGLVTKQKVFDAANTHCYTLETHYDSMGRVVKRTNELGQVITSNYDDNGNKDYEKLHGAGFYTRYSYDKANRLVATTEYHEDGTECETTYEYDLMGNKIASTDRYGNTTKYEYDELNRLIKIRYPEVEGISHKIEKEYDIFDNVSREYNEKGAKTSYEYNARRQPTLIKYDDHTEEKFEYNLNGTLASKWDRSGTKTSFKYDDLGRVLKTTIYDPSGKKLAQVQNTYDSFHLLSTTDAMGYTTHFEYDGAGRKVKEIKETEGNFSKTKFSYDALGRLERTKVYFGLGRLDYIAIQLEYDLLNRIICEKREDSSGKCLGWTKYEYDVLGNRTKVETSQNEYESAVSETHFNSRSEPTSLIDEYGHTTTVEHHHAHKNFQGQKTLKRFTRDPLGNTSEEYFDVLGRVVSIIKRNSSGTLLASSEYRYSPTGQKIKQIEHVVIDGNVDHDYIITWEHDKLDRVIKLTEQPGTPEEKNTCYQYDASGRVSKLTKPDGVVLTHDYDALGRLVHLASSDGTISYSYSYDLHNNPLEVRDEIAQLVTKRSYDAWDRILNESLQDRFHLSFGYDPLGRLVFLSAPDGSSVRYEYEVAHLRNVKRFSPSGDLRYEHTYHKFDWQNRVLESSLIGSTGKLDYAWDKKGRLVKVDSPHFRESIAPDGFDAVGNLKKYTFVDAIGEIEFNASYDDLYQLSAESGVQSHCYKNDSINNRKSKDSDAYTLDFANKLLSDSQDQFIYDKNGNCIERKSQNKSIFYSYDALDRLVKVTEGSNATSYLYDSFHRRIAHTTNNGTEYFLYLGLREIGLLDATGKLSEFRVLGLGKGAELGATVALELQENIYCPIHDHRGNVIALVDPSTSKVKENYRYTAFGEREVYDESGAKQFESKIHNPWGFASKRFDPETGFVYFSRRYYAPAHGRWATPDPLDFADGPNLYAYVHNNPLTRFDLYGLWDADDVDTAHHNVMLYTAVEFTARGLVSMAGIGWELTNRSFPTGVLTRKESLPIGHYFEQVSGPFERLAKNVRTPVLQHANSIIGNNGPSAETTYGVTDTSLTVGSILTAGYQLGKAGIKKLTSCFSKGSEGLLDAGKSLSGSDISHYVPRSSETGKLLPLPRNIHGKDIPSSLTPHTQIGTRIDRNGLPYRQSREWGYNGKEIKTTDWTNHGFPLTHSNPHDHPFLKNPTGGTPKRGDPEKFSITPERKIRETQ